MATEQAVGVESLQRHRHRVAFDRLAVPAGGRTPALLGVRVAMLEAAGHLPQLAAIRSTDKGREEIFGEAARGQRSIRVQRLEVRTTQRVALVDTHVDGPAFLEYEALREAEVRESARAVFGGLGVDARVDLRALPRPRAHAEARGVGLAADRRWRVRTPRTAWSHRIGGSRRRGCRAPGSRRSRACRRASCPPRRAA